MRAHRFATDIYHSYQHEATFVLDLKEGLPWADRKRHSIM